MKYFSMIELYLDNEMSQDEKKQFEAELLVNTELEEEFRLTKDVEDFIRRYADKEKFIEVLNEVHEKYVRKFNEN